MSRFSTLLVAFAVAALSLALAPAQTTPQVSLAGAGEYAPQLVTVDTPTRADKDRLTALGLDLTEHAGHDYVEVVLHSAAEEAALREAGFTWDVRIPDLIAREIERVELDAAFAEANPVTDLPSGRNSYRVLGDYEQEIDQLVADHSDVAKRISIGQSVEGRDLIGIEIGVDVHGPEDGRPVFLMFGAHHAREWPSAELPMEFAHDLLQHYAAGDERVVDLLTRGRAIIVPVSNPDGFDASRTSGAIDLRPVDGGGTVSILATPGNAYKRKNCRYIDGQTQPAGTCVLVPSPGGFGTGIDLNRNYGALWGGPGTEANPASPIYRGPDPFSEPETQAIRRLISTRHVTTLITNHTFSNLVLRPVGVKPSTIHPDGYPVGFAPDECFPTAEGDRGSQWLGELMSAQNGYINQFGWELYDTTGTTEDYSYNATGGYGYTFEIGPDEFHPPYQHVVAEYTGETEAAESVTVHNAHERTTEAAADCGEHEHETVGGGNREAFLIAFENAVNAATHSVITGTAPAGATLTLERSGVFPLWDGTLFGDSVATSMVADGGGFEWHVNPSTRPFVQSRMAPILGDPKDEMTASGQTPPTLFETGQTQEHPFEVTEPADVLTATVRAALSASPNLAEYHLRLIDPSGEVVATATAYGGTNVITWTGPEGAGVAVGTYTLQVENIANPAMAYELEARTQDVISDRTPRQFEVWTLSCLTADGLLGQQPVQVDRGQQVDVGDVCGVGEEEDEGEDRDRRGPPDHARNPRSPNVFAP